MTSRGHNYTVLHKNFTIQHLTDGEHPSTNLVDSMIEKQICEDSKFVKIVKKERSFERKTLAIHSAAAKQKAWETQAHCHTSPAGVAPIVMTEMCKDRIPTENFVTVQDRTDSYSSPLLHLILHPLRRTVGTRL